MKQFFTSVNVKEDFKQDWIDEIKENSKHAKSVLFHIYTGLSDVDLLDYVMKQLKDAIPDCNIVGTNSGGEIKGGTVADKCFLISCMIFDQTDIEVCIYDDLSGNEKETGKNLRRYLNRSLSKDLKAVELLLPGALLNTLDMYEELKSCDPDIYMFGGYAGNHDADLNKAFVIANGKLYNNALVVVMYCGDNFHINVAKSAGWQKLGLPLKITKAYGNVLQEIDGIPAVEAYKRYLNIDADENFVENTNEFPVAAYVDGEELLRHTTHILDDGSLMLAGCVIEGWDIYLTFGNPSGIIEEIDNRLEKVFDFAPEGILLYSCFVRKLFWDNFADIEMEPFQQIAPSCGFHTFGEVLRNMETGDIMEYNITLLSIAMREGEKKPLEGTAPKANSFILKGQASLIKRLSELVSSSTIEIQRSYEKLKYVSEHDNLTGLYNRGRMETIIKDAFKKTGVSGIKSSLVMFDIDHFKNVNDIYGHHTGDIVLQEIASLAESMLNHQNNEAAGRWGGEEFFIVLPDCNEDKVKKFAESFRKKVEDFRFDERLALTISIGTMTITGKEDLRDVFIRIDDALYAAKNRGRNMVVMV